MMTREQKSLRFAAFSTLIAFGPLSALSAFAPLSGPMGVVLDAVIWPVDGLQGALASETRLLLAILGGITFGWGIMIWQLAGAAMERDPELVRTIIRTSILLWFAVDSTGSVLAGATLNVLANCVFLALFLVPMWRPAAARAA